MDILLIIAVVLILISLLGFVGLVAALRDAAWVVLVVGIAVLLISFIL